MSITKGGIRVADPIYAVVSRFAQPVRD